MRRIGVIWLALLFSACRNGAGEAEPRTFMNPLLDQGSSPWAVFHEGKYYYTQNMSDHISLWCTEDLTRLREAPERVIWAPEDAFHLYGPEIHRLDGKWYVYFSFDRSGGRYLGVLECDGDDPMTDTFTFKGGIGPGNLSYHHPTVFEHRGVRYLVWSGLEQPRVFEERQCLFIASLADPWTLGSERVKIAEPQYEWECQWVGEEGVTSTYPIYVNAAPEFLYSRDSTRLLLLYSASTSVSPYYCEGLLWADADSDPLDPSSWRKCPEPVFSQDPEADVFGPGHLSFVTSADRSGLYVLYHARGGHGGKFFIDNRSPRLQPVRWGVDGLPDLGAPVPTGTPVPKPSWMP